MNLIKSFFSLAVLVVFYQYCHAQSEDYAVEVIPPSPDAAALGQYGEHQVSNYTGTPTIEIPIFEIKTGGITLPISLSYHASGVKVEQIPSRIGMGWSLNAGGLITRSMRGGMEDENSNTFACPDGDYDQGVCKRLGYFYSGFSIAGGPSPDVDDLIPDLFFYNFNGNTGKFVFDKNQNVNFTPYRSFEVEHTIGGGEYTPGDVNNELSKFEITTNEGIMYTFDKPEKTFSFANCYEGISPLLNSFRTFPSAWYVSKIQDLNSDRSITFTYLTLQSVQYDLSLTRTYQSDLMSDCRIMYDVSQNTPDRCDNYLTMGLKLIQRIDFENGHIIFKYNDNRQDLIGDKRLTDIEIYDSNNVLIKSYTINHIYSQAIGSNDALGKRLFLESIVEKGKNGSEKPAYTFDYKNINSLPPRNSAEQDLFGYFNDNNATSLKPKVYIYPFYGTEAYSLYQRDNYSGAEFIVDGNDRSTNETAILAGSLEKITYPTGGHSLFEFEPHEFRHLGKNIKGGGIRIKKITTHDKVDLSNNITKEFFYTFDDNPGESSGGITNLPQYAYLGGPYEFGMGNVNYFNIYTIRKSRNQSILGTTNGSIVGYSEVIVKQSGNGKIVYSYVSPLDLPNEDPEYTVFQANNLDICDINLIGIFQSLDRFPFFSCTDLDARRGLLLSEKIYTETGKIVREKSNNYTLVSKGTITLENGIYYDEINPFSPEFRIHGTSKIYSEVMLLTNEVQTIYGTGTGEPFTLTTNKTYDTDHLLIKEEVRQSGDGNVYKTLNRYPLDFTNSESISAGDIESIGLSNLVQRNIISEPVEVISFKNDQVIGSVLRTFKKFTGGVYPHRVLFLETNKSLPLGTLPDNFNMSYLEEITTANFKFHKDSKYEMFYQFDDYDIHGNLLKQTGRDGTLTEYQWSAEYNHTLPTVKIINPGPDERKFLYSYDLLVGMTSQTDPNGITTFYKYDDLNRLELIRDHEDNILQHYEYHYHNEGQ